MRRLTITSALLAAALFMSTGLHAQTCNNLDLDLSADGNFIYFTSDRSGSYELYRSDANGSNAIRLTDNAVDEYHPRVSPDGMKLVYQVGAYGPSAEIWMMQLDWSGTVQLTDNDIHDGSPSFSPDGMRILFDAWDLSSYPEIFTMALDGSDRVQLTDESGAYWNSTPTWRPDGSKILYMNGLNADNHLVEMNTDGSNQVDITPTNAFGYSDNAPRYNPAGTQIVFYTSEYNGYGGPMDLVLCDADGSNWERMTFTASGDADNRQPCFDPDGSGFFFASNREGDYQIRRMDLDGSNDLKISDCADVGMSGLPETALVQVSVAPNPFSEFSFVNLGRAPHPQTRVVLVDAAGRQHSADWSPASNGLTIRRGDLASGLYLLQILERETVSSAVVQLH